MIKGTPLWHLHQSRRCGGCQIGNSAKMSNRLAFSVDLEGEDSAPHASTRPWPWLCLGLQHALPWHGMAECSHHGLLASRGGTAIGNGNGIHRKDVACTTVSGLGCGVATMMLAGNGMRLARWRSAGRCRRFNWSSSDAGTSRVCIWRRWAARIHQSRAKPSPPRPHGPRTESSAPVRRQNATRANQGPKLQPPYLVPTPDCPLLLALSCGHVGL